MHGVVVTKGQDLAVGPVEAHTIVLSHEISLSRSLCRAFLPQGRSKHFPLLWCGLQTSQGCTPSPGLSIKILNRDGPFSQSASYSKSLPTVNNFIDFPSTVAFYPARLPALHLLYHSLSTRWLNRISNKYCTRVPELETNQFELPARFWNKRWKLTT